VAKCAVNIQFFATSIEAFVVGTIAVTHFTASLDPSVVARFVATLLHNYNPQNSRDLYYKVNISLPRLEHMNSFNRKNWSSQSIQHTMI
jgi:hypothetical protein